MLKNLTIILLFITTDLVHCLGNTQQAKHAEIDAKSNIDLVLLKNRQLQHELLTIRDSINSANLFNRLTEQSNRDKQIELEQQLLQRQETLQRKEQILDNSQEKLKLVAIILIIVIALSIPFLLYLIWTSWKSREKRLTSSISLLELENNYRQKVIIENITARMETQETERERISRELHDGIGGNLVAIRLLLQSVDEDNPILKELQQLVANTQQEIRAISHNLAPPRLDEISFEELLLHHIGHLKTTTPINFEGILLPMRGWNKLNIKFQTDIFRLVQELTGNIIKHSKATKANISLRLEDESVSLLAEDNGIGFIVEKGYEGIGLQNLKLRVNYLKGKIDINSTPGKGTIVMIEIPINRPNSTKNDEA